MKRPPPPRSLSQSLVERDRVDVRVIGARRRLSSDIYHVLVGMSWPAFFLGFIAAFIAINSLFAGLYLLSPGELEGGHADDMPAFARAFFFSVHTLATVG
ncbi:MAG: hypothetical protein KGK00_02935 [Paracoccaceae bacterium]|nr:hypothetical protein [Paracoccaceae bacterium]